MPSCIDTHVVAWLGCAGMHTLWLLYKNRSIVLLLVVGVHIDALMVLRPCVEVHNPGHTETSSWRIPCKNGNTASWLGCW